MGERFWRRVQQTPTCWLWTGPTTPQGHPVFAFSVDGRYRRLRAQPLVWQAYYGPLPADRIVRSACGLPACVRPEHLRLRPGHARPPGQLRDRRLATGRTQRRPVWWTRERVTAALAQFHQGTGQAPVSSVAWGRLTASAPTVGVHQGYPSAVTVLRYFGSFRAAWASLGLALDRAGAPWAAAEDRYLREQAGRLPTATIARALDRSVNGVKLRLRRLDLRIREAQGWPLQRVQRASGVPVHVLRRYIACGEVPVLAGVVCTYVDPADLVVVTELDWAHVSSALEAAVLGSLRWRLVQILAGRDWRAMRPHRPVTAPPPPRPAAITVGSCVRVAGAVPTARGTWGRVGRVERVFWSASRRGSAPEWRARVCFAKQHRRRPGGTIVYVLPLAALEPEPAPGGDILPAVTQHQLARIERKRTSHPAR